VTDLNGNSGRGPGVDRTGVVRRVVTGIDEQGRSYIISDGISPNRHTSPSIAGFGAAQLWYTKPGPVSNAGEQDNAAADTPIPMHPELGATIFRIADFPPDSAYTDSGKAALFSEIGGDDARAGASQSESKHFWFHKTDSIDYAIVLEGEISLLLDEHECLLRAGDVVVQRGTSHAWANRSDRPCRMAFVLIGAPPVPVAAESGLASQAS
jgi:mannose-6-phosphate isomerase-like protein (cupin superfamily)